MSHYFRSFFHDDAHNIRHNRESSDDLSASSSRSHNSTALDNVDIESLIASYKPVLHPAAAAQLLERKFNTSSYLHSSGSSSTSGAHISAPISASASMESRRISTASSNSASSSSSSVMLATPTSIDGGPSYGSIMYRNPSSSYLHQHQQRLPPLDEQPAVMKCSNASASSSLSRKSSMASTTSSLAQSYRSIFKKRSGSGTSNASGRDDNDSIHHDYSMHHSRTPSGGSSVYSGKSGKTTNSSSGKKWGKGKGQSDVGAAAAPQFFSGEISTDMEIIPSNHSIRSSSASSILSGNSGSNADPHNLRRTPSMASSYSFHSDPELAMQQRSMSASSQRSTSGQGQGNAPQQQQQHQQHRLAAPHLRRAETTDIASITPTPNNYHLASSTSSSTRFASHISPRSSMSSSTTSSSSVQNRSFRWSSGTASSASTGISSHSGNGNGNGSGYSSGGIPTSSSSDTILHITNSNARGNNGSGSGSARSRPVPFKSNSLPSEQHLQHQQQQTQQPIYTIHEVTDDPSIATGITGEYPSPTLGHEYGSGNGNQWLSSGARNSMISMGSSNSNGSGSAGAASTGRRTPSHEWAGFNFAGLQISSPAAIEENEDARDDIFASSFQHHAELPSNDKNHNSSGDGGGNGQVGGSYVLQGHVKNRESTDSTFSNWQQEFEERMSRTILDFPSPPIIMSPNSRKSSVASDFSLAATSTTSTITITAPKGTLFEDEDEDQYEYEEAHPSSTSSASAVAGSIHSSHSSSSSSSSSSAQTTTSTILMRRQASNGSACEFPTPTLFSSCSGSSSSTPSLGGDDDTPRLPSFPHCEYTHSPNTSQSLLRESPPTSTSRNNNNNNNNSPRNALLYPLSLPTVRSSPVSSNNSLSSTTTSARNHPNNLKKEVNLARRGSSDDMSIRSNRSTAASSISSSLGLSVYTSAPLRKTATNSSVQNQMNSIGPGGGGEHQQQQQVEPLGRKVSVVGGGGQQGTRLQQVHFAE